MCLLFVHEQLVLRCNKHATSTYLSCSSPEPFVMSLSSSTRVRFNVSSAITDVTAATRKCRSRTARNLGHGRRRRAQMFYSCETSTKRHNVRLLCHVTECSSPARCGHQSPPRGQDDKMKGGNPSVFRVITNQH